MKKIIIFILLASGFLYANANNEKKLDYILKLLKEEKYTKAYKQLIILEKKGDKNAPLALGNLYHDGKGVKKDIKKAVYWYKKAIAKKNIAAYMQLANVYKNGEFGNNEYFKAFDLYLQYALKTNNKKAQYFLAAMYYEGKGIKRDFKKALYWAKKAFKQREPRSSFILALLYKDGMVVKRDLKKSLEYAHIAKSFGYKQADKLIRIIKKQLRK